MDNLFHSLKQLQSEKLCLEQKLHDEKRKRLSLEQECEQVSTTCSQTQEKHMRLAETHAIAEQKVEQSIKEVMSLQLEVDSKRPQMEQCQREIEMVKQEQSTMLLDFQDQLSSFSSNLFHAKSFYQKENLTTEMQREEQRAEELDKNIENMKSEVINLKDKLEKLDRKIDAGKSNFDLENTLVACYRASERDEGDLKKELSIIKDETASLQNALQNQASDGCQSIRPVNSEEDNAGNQ